MFSRSSFDSFFTLSVQMVAVDARREGEGEGGEFLGTLLERRSWGGLGGGGRGGLRLFRLQVREWYGRIAGGISFPYRPWGRNFRPAIAVVKQAKKRGLLRGDGKELQEALQGCRCLHGFYASAYERFTAAALP